MANNRYFAIGMKGWVEIRTGPNVPILKVSEVVRKGGMMVEVPIYERYYSSYLGRYVRDLISFKSEKRDLKIRLKSWQGGRKFGIYKTR